MLPVRKHLHQRRIDAQKDKLPRAWLAMAMRLDRRFRGYHQPRKTP
jgi:hypothetical protein